LFCLPKKLKNLKPGQVNCELGGGVKVTTWPRFGRGGGGHANF
jgi:hypothetical protein